jgi:hypothetical protein
MWPVLIDADFGSDFSVAELQVKTQTKLIRTPKGVLFISLMRAHKAAHLFSLARRSPKQTLKQGPRPAPRIAPSAQVDFKTALSNSN